VDQLALFIAGLAGLAVSSYFTGVTYGHLPADWGFVPRACRLEARTCHQILDTREARVFGLPNAVLGMVYYAVLLAVAARGVRLSEPWATLLLAVAWGTVGLGVFLTYRLLAVLRVPCPLCLFAHALNLGIALLLTRSIAA
jgi:uncharacterized membrane protein